ncbi:TIGR03619 family F420-dependent LLM class oxidoreductase [Catenuloplanes sp. NPDC051500]|uniref:TIGR03619 family F420-dependent LLM class oxidoreductase n=1 Tax=Catenuloplanes sp. NPDC051500 TaxID=3363959 RepID=UPI0037AD2EE6
MKFGVVSHTTDYTINPVELGKELMCRGLQALFVPEHSHIPVKRETPWTGLSHADQAATDDPMFLPDWYENALDPFISLAAAATASPGLVVGTGVALAAQRHAISFAKAVSSLEAVIGPDRFICGVAAGWNVEEMRHHGVAEKQRWRALYETVEAAIRIWTSEEAEYHGTVVDFDPIRSFPKPATRPHPPVLFGGHSRATLDRIVAVGDGWMPVVGRGARPTIDDVEAGIAFLASRSESAGRTFITTVLDVRVDPATIERYRDMGVDRFLFGGPPLPRDEMLRNLDTWADAAARLGA